jgi:hypothetical protein
MREILEKKNRFTNANFVQWSFTTDNTMVGSVRPAEVAFWQSAFCETTNRLDWGELYLLKSFAPQAVFCLPDGSHVDRQAWEKWLNESIAAGWSVGISLVQSNRSVLVASRKRGEAGTRPDGAPNAAPPPR